MPKTKISEYSATANSNTDVASINIDEGCAPSGINNAIRAIMGHLKDFQQGTNGDPFNGPVNGTLGATTASTANVTTLTTSSTVTHNGGTANGVAYLNGSKVLTTGSALVFDGTTLNVGLSEYVGRLGVTSGYAKTDTAERRTLSLRSTEALASNPLELYFALQGNATSANQAGVIQTGHYGSDFNAVLAINPNGGNVGIGTSSPAVKFQIYGGAGVNTYSRIDTAAGQEAGLQFADGGTLKWTIYKQSGNVLGWYNHAASSVAMTLDSSGNLGLGVTPSAWGSSSSYKALQLGGSSYSFLAANITQYIYGNAYFDGTNNRYINSGSGACSFGVNAGNTFQWNIAGSGTAGNAITFTQAMTLDASGNLGLGVTTVLGRAQFNVSDTSTTILNNPALYLSNTGTATTNQRVDLGFRWQDGTYNGSSSISAIRESGTSRLTAIAFCPANSSGDATERARIDSSGNLLVGDTSAYSGSRLSVKTGNNNGTTHAWYAKNSSATVLGYQRDDGLFNTGAATNSPYNFTTASAANLFVDSSGTFYRSTSSLKYKTDVQDATHGLAEVLSLRPVTYRGKNDGETIFGGLIAEEVDAAGLTEFVQYAEDGTPDALAYGNMVSLCIKAIQQQQAIIQSLTARITALESA